MTAPEAPESPQRRLHAYLSGRVQGVGMRMTVAQLAQDLALCGWVRNLPDGRVELVAEGPEAELERFLKTLHARMPGYIKEVQRAWEPASGEFDGFEVTH